MTVVTKPKEKKIPDPPYRHSPAVLPLPWQTTKTTAVWLWLAASAGILISGLGFWLAREQVFLLLSLVGDQAAVSRYLQSFGWRGPAVLAIVQVIQVVVAFIPGHVFIVAGGYVYGFGPGFLINWLSVVAASQLSYTLARLAGRPFVTRIVPDDILNRWDKISAEKGFAFFTISFILPIFPTDAMNFVAGLSGLSSRKFLAANLIGRLPGVAMLTIIGSHGLQFSTPTWIAIGALAVGTYVVGRFVLARIEPKEE